MFDGIPYGLFFDTDCARVSIDNLRIKFVYRHRKWDYERKEASPTLCRLYSLLDGVFLRGFSSGSTFSFDVVWARCDFFRIGNYVRTANITVARDGSPIGSFAILLGRYCFDSSVKNIAPEAVLDVNPNKIPAPVLSYFVSLLSDGALERKIVRYDVAFDVLRARSDVSFLPPERSEYKLFKTGLGITEYSGQRGHHSAVKIYDKQIESGLVFPCTRVEITVEADKFKTMADLFPKIFSFVSFNFDINFSSLPFEVQACILHPDLLPILKQSISANTYRKHYKAFEAYQNCCLAPSDFKKIDDFILASLSSYLKFEVCLEV